MNLSGGSTPVRNALTVDVEDYFHVWAFRKHIRYAAWESQPSRVELNTQRALDLLADLQVRATFFILGWVAERFPALVREIQAAGHELGCHSYAHRLAYEMTPSEFREDTRQALAAIEDAAGVSVRLFRASGFSITARSLWALEVLMELGFTADSSIFPARGPFYGIPKAPRNPFRIRGHGLELVEFPLPIAAIGPWRFPATGGAYLRLLPLWWQVWALGLRAARGEPAVLYFHPWELDSEQPRLPSRTLAARGHYFRLDETERRLRRLVGQFAFGKLSEVVVSNAPLYQVSLENERKREARLTRVSDQ